jgi:hypothetical protein
MLLARLSGWWRLWIVASVIYGAMIVVFTWHSYPHVESISYEASHLKRLSDRTLLILGGRVQPSIAADTPMWARAPIILEMPNGHRFEVIGNTTPEQSKEVAKDYVDVLNSIANERRISALKDAFLAWTVPCLLILALGWAVGWIQRGFGHGAT